DRGHAVVPGCRRAAHAAIAGHADPRGQRFSLFGRMVDYDLPRSGAGADGPGGEPARRLAARCAQPQAAVVTGARNKTAVPTVQTNVHRQGETMVKPSTVLAGVLAAVGLTACQTTGPGMWGP